MAVDGENKIFEDKRVHAWVSKGCVDQNLRERDWNQGFEA